MSDIVDRLNDSLSAGYSELRKEAAREILQLRKERDALRAKIEVMERQEPVAWLHETRPDSGVVTDTVKRVWEEAVVGSLSAYSIPLCIATGAQPAPSLPDTHNDRVVGLDYQGAMSCARQRAKKEAGLLYPEGDARKEEEERELASEYYRQYTTPNQGAMP